LTVESLLGSEAFSYAKSEAVPDEAPEEFAEFSI
jgi:hypothetical protein